MASASNNESVGLHKDDEDDEDIEALRLAALKTLRKKPIKSPVSSSVTFKPHIGNPNLIAIIPEGAEPLNHQRPPPTGPAFYRHHPHQGRGPPHQPYRGANTTLKVLPQVSIPNNNISTVPNKKEDDGNQQEEEVSTKFSRFEDTNLNQKMF